MRRVRDGRSSGEPISRFTPQQLDLLEKLNRVDRRDSGCLKQIAVPDRWDLPTLAYSPLPQFVPGAASEAQALIVDLPAQVFGANRVSTCPARPSVMAAFARWRAMRSGSLTGAGRHYRHAWLSQGVRLPPDLMSAGEF